MIGVGSINIAYDDYGQMKKVSSKSGGKVAHAVSSAFQLLLNIVKPSGVSLTL